MMAKKITAPRKVTEQFIGIDKPAISPVGYGIADIEGSDAITLSFFWSPPENPNLNHVMFRATLSSTAIKALVDALSKQLTKKSVHAISRKEPEAKATT